MPVHVCADVGGTFTDLFAVEAPSGRIVVVKTQSTADAVGGIIAALAESGIDARDVATLVLGSTRATNAIAEGKLAPVAFFATEGFSDTLEIRRLWREHIFGWQWDRPRAIVPGDLRFGVRGRIDWRGQEVEPLDLGTVDAAIDAVLCRGIPAVAVSLLFSFLDPRHEHRVKARLAERAPGVRVVLSSDVNPEIKDYERGSTTVVAAALSPLVDGMLGDLERRLAEAGVPARPQVIKSNGGIMSAATAREKPLEIVRSGPAGGVASLARFAEDTGIANLIGVDIGGTTADVSVITEGAVAYTQQASLAWDIPIRVAMADVRSVGAGGGSIAWIDTAGRLNVGPQSAGASPGPACYGRGGIDPTVTDAALVAGLIDPDRFLGGSMRIDVEAARDALASRIAGPLGLPLREGAGGVLKLVTARMAQLIGEMTVREGLDPRDYAVVGFGGGGPLFVAALAEEMEARVAIVPMYPAVWSAFGGLLADIVHDYAKSIIGPVTALPTAELDAVALHLAELAREDIARDGRDAHDATFDYAFDVRYAGQSHELSVPVDGGPPFRKETLAAVERRFEELHERMFAHRRPEDPRELTTIRLRARLSRDIAVPIGAGPYPSAPRPAARRRVTLYGYDDDLVLPVHDRASLRAGERMDGPALVDEDQSVTLVPPGFRLEVAPSGYLLIDRCPL